MNTIPPSKIRLSHSSLDILDRCEREYQLTKLLETETDDEVLESEHFVFGKAFGAGCAEYLRSQDIDAALWIIFMRYHPMTSETKTKNFWRCCHGLIANIERLDQFLSEWEIVSFNGKPAIELGIRLSIDARFYNAGFLDIVVRNKLLGTYAVVDIKTTGSTLTDLSPLYKNSGQVLGYSIVLDKIVGRHLSSYSAIYLALQYPGTVGATPKLQVFDFTKTLLDRLQWFLTLKLDCERIETMLNLNHFPKRGSNCLRYNRPCPFFGQCHMHSLDSYVKDIPDPHTYDYQFNLDELIQDHINRMKEQTHEA